MDKPVQPIPSKEQIQTFPRFQNLSLENVVVINSLPQCKNIEYILKTAHILGFDTESI